MIEYLLENNLRGNKVKISSHLTQTNITTKVRTGPTPGLFKSLLEQFVTNEKALSTAIPKLPGEFKSIIELQRSCSALQLQVECASRVADSFTGSIKKIQQLGGQG